MPFSLLSLWSPPRSTRPKLPPAQPRFRPQVEGFEDRVVPASPVQDAPALVTPAAITDLITITGVEIDPASLAIEIIDGVPTLVADGTVTGTLAGLPFTADITNFALQLLQDDPDTPGATECAVLDLELGPINLALLGLHVDTSPICLEVTAIEGGGLLGDLLCDLAGGGLGGLPALPTTGQLGDLVDQLVDLLNGVLNSPQNGPGNGGNGGGSGDSVCLGETEILDLSLGPVDLTVLGLNVYLHDCEDGPVQVCVSATAGEGLLGNLLGRLGDFPNLNLDLGDITQIVNRATQLLADGDLSGNDIGKLTSLINRLARR